MPPHEHQAWIRFESFELNLQTRELRKDGRPIRLQDQPGKLLVLLACRAGELVTRAEIEKALWREDEFVEFEHAVNTAMRKVREALGDDLERPRFIETLPRKGYRFIAAVETSAATGTQSRSNMDASQPVQGLRSKIPVRSGSAGQTPADDAARAGEALEVAPSGGDLGGDDPGGGRNRIQPAALPCTFAVPDGARRVPGNVLRRSL